MTAAELREAVELAKKLPRPEAAIAMPQRGTRYTNEADRVAGRLERLKGYGLKRKASGLRANGMARAIPQTYPLASWWQRAVDKAKPPANTLKAEKPPRETRQKLASYESVNNQ